MLSPGRSVILFPLYPLIQFTSQVFRHNLKTPAQSTHILSVLPRSVPRGRNGYVYGLNSFCEVVREAWMKLLPPVLQNLY
jgi:hypothetical protein